MPEFLQTLTSTLREFLQLHLPGSGKAWWKDRVLDRLSFQQLQHVESKNLSSLSDLDLAGLLRVLDGNWAELNQALNFPRELRNWTKECQMIRNRWAHAPSAGIPDVDHYRDLDTVRRVLDALGEDEKLSEKITQEINLIGRRINSVSDAHAEKKDQSEGSRTRFEIGDVVRIKSDQSLTGAIVSVQFDEIESRYDVFHDGKIDSFYESQLELHSVGQEVVVTLERMHASLSAAQLCHPSSDKLFSLLSSRINFVPYQYRPVIKFIKSERPRLLIADEVGVGKTIEAGLILKELSARNDLEKVLIICPKPLITEQKWLREMRRFDEEFVHLDSKALDYCVEETDNDGVWPLQYSRAILPFSLCDENLLYGSHDGRRKRLGLSDLENPPVFDLVIVDEAHHIRNTDTYSHRVVRYFCENAHAAVFLSATPIQTEDSDLFNLLRVLRDDLFVQRKDFDRMAEPNKFINQAVETVRRASGDWQLNTREMMRAALDTTWGSAVFRVNPIFQDIFDSLEGDISDERRLQIVRGLESLYTFSNVISRTRRRDIGDFTTRKPETVEIEFTSDQSKVYQNLLELIASILRSRHGDQPLKFLMSTITRQASSCIFGLVPHMESILSRNMSSFQLSELDFLDSSGEIPMLEEFQGQIEEFLKEVQQLDLYDPKYEAFKSIIEQKQKRENRKLLVFTSFIHTLRYLHERLVKLGVRVGKIEGSVDDAERRELRERFSKRSEDPDSIDILLSTEVGAEGLDYQFCDAIVNYDIPWNPMRVEQRIGRIDRYGQASETVAIYNFVTPGTVDAEIYARCLLRLGVFRSALGGSEEILGQITKKLRDISQSFALTKEEREERLKQLEDNDIRKMHEQISLEEEQSKLFGLDLSIDDERSINEATSFWLTPERLSNLVQTYLDQKNDESRSYIEAYKVAQVIRLSQGMRNALLKDINGVKQHDRQFKKWKQWLSGTDSFLRLTFEADHAKEHPDLEFVTAAHPLTRQAARALNPSKVMRVHLKMTGGFLESGQYTFAIYKWEWRSLRNDFDFKVVSDDINVSESLLNNIDHLEQDHEPIEFNDAAKSTIESLHYRLWTQERANFIEQEDSILQARAQSLMVTHKARFVQAQEQLLKATDKKIQRMRESEMGRIEEDFNRRNREIIESKNKIDIHVSPIVWGTLRVY